MDARTDFTPAEDLPFLQPEELASYSFCGDALSNRQSARLQHHARTLRAWWARTTKPDFLVSKVSRRDQWQYLLPIYAPVAMLVDLSLDDKGFTGPSGDWAILSLNISIFVILGFAACSLPLRTFRSDLLIAFLFGAHTIGHRLLSPEESEATGGCQVMAICAMSFAGVHSFAMALVWLCSLIASAITFPGARPEFLVSLYVLGAHVFAENRLASLFAERSSMPCSIGRGEYKALRPRTPISGEELLPGSRDDTSVPSVGSFSLPSDFGDVPLGPALRAPSVTSRASSASHWSPRSSLADYVFSRFMPQTEIRSPREHQITTANRPSVATSSVLVQPTAANHDAPEFPDSAFLEPSRRSSAKDAMAGSLAKIPEAMPLTDQFAPIAPPDPVLSNTDCKGLEASTPTNAGSSEAGDSEVSDGSLRGVKMVGFMNAKLNALFVEVREPEYATNGCKTYWAPAGEHFLYYNANMKRWSAAPAKKFKKTKHGESHEIASGPENYDILDRVCNKGWQEWDSTIGSFVFRPSAGVECLGKVRAPSRGVKSLPATSQFP